MSDDLPLRAAWQDGDTAAGQALFSRHFREVHRFFENKVGVKADELSQRTFLACVGSRTQFAITCPQRLNSLQQIGGRRPFLKPDGEVGARGLPQTTLGVADGPDGGQPGDGGGRHPGRRAPHVRSGRDLRERAGELPAVRRLRPDVDGGGPAAVRGLWLAALLITPRPHPPEEVRRLAEEHNRVLRKRLRAAASPSNERPAVRIQTVPYLGPGGGGLILRAAF